MTLGVSMSLWYMYHFQGKVHTGNVTSSAFNTQSTQVPMWGKGISQCIQITFKCSQVPMWEKGISLVTCIQYHYDGYRVLMYYMGRLMREKRGSSI